MASDHHHLCMQCHHHHPSFALQCKDLYRTTSLRDGFEEQAIWLPTNSGRLVYLMTKKCGNPTHKKLWQERVNLPNFGVIFKFLGEMFANGGRMITGQENLTTFSTYIQFRPWYGLVWGKVLCGDLGEFTGIIGLVIYFWHLEPHC